MPWRRLLAWSLRDLSAGRIPTIVDGGSWTVVAFEAQGLQPPPPLAVVTRQVGWLAVVRNSR